ncbi:zinc-ribbon domain-containing protein [Chitinophaga sp. SYP-B3965]|uniref:zinc-ribbon domain-containing protein n=1 Tax=Chitinophaga sp. SYP-B3965 TaxID=2663120 RepID=UPI001299539E|nr:zinc ribbon domain-containing protein [Chitinophaga sp. SYP-B3965]MRG46119.1 zinc-ribbon domain-containing protein [Chitinophaga sp. SYP-B3965]
MFIIYGKRNATIQKYAYNQESCKNCKAFDMQVEVFKKYFHVFYIPFFPYGRKTATITCKSCGNLAQDESLQEHAEKTAKPPFYYYAGLMIIAALALLIVYAVIAGNKAKAQYVAAPAAGDVFTIKKENTYYFIRLTEVKGDSVFGYHSNLEYNRYVSKFAKGDFFVKDDIISIAKKDLKEMLDKDEIRSAERYYSDYKGFDRIK